MSFAGLAVAAAGFGTTAALGAASVGMSAISMGVNAAQKGEEMEIAKKRAQMAQPAGGGSWGGGGPYSQQQEPYSQQQEPYSQQQMAMQAQLMQQAGQPLPGLQQNQNVFGGNASGLGANPLVGTQRYFAEGGDVEEQDRGVDLKDSDYIIPADVVSALGNGSTEAGARVLEAFMEHVKRQGATLQMHGQGIAGAGATRVG